MRLRRLRRAGFLMAQPLGPISAGGGTLVYTLGRKAAETLRPNFKGRLPNYMKESDRRSGAFLEHLLLRNDLRVVLELLDRDSQLQLLDFRHHAEQVAVAASHQRQGQQQRHVSVADAYAAVLVAGQCFTFLIEIDRGTVPLARMSNRYATYQAWWSGGGASQRFGAAPLRVLTLTTTQVHMRNLAKAAPRSALFWFATLDALDLVDPETLLQARWLTADGRSSALFT